MSGILRAVDSFAVGNPDGTKRMVLAGQEVRDDDPIVKGREALFVPLDDIIDRNAAPVEAATARPGEKRNTGRSKKAPAKAS